MAIRVHLAGYLGAYTNSNLDIDLAKAGDVLDVLSSLSGMFPHVRERILDDQERTRPYVNIFVNENNIRDLQRERTKVSDGDHVYILAAVAGG